MHFFLAGEGDGRGLDDGGLCFLTRLSEEFGAVDRIRVVEVERMPTLGSGMVGGTAVGKRIIDGGVEDDQTGDRGSGGEERWPGE